MYTCYIGIQAHRRYIMQVITPFFTWILNELPNFLMAEPIIYFVALFVLVAIINIIIRIFHIK